MPKWTPYRFTTERAWDDAHRLQPDAVRRVLVVGDLHGEVRNLRMALERAVALGVDAVVQVEDFWLADQGWHDHDPEEALFMWEAHDAPLQVVVVDGNHEAWPALNRYAATPAAQAAFASRRPMHLGDIPGDMWPIWQLDSDGWHLWANVWS